MMRETMSALLACLVTFVLCAVAYPAAVWGWPSSLSHTRPRAASCTRPRSHRDRLGADRPAVRVGPLFSSPAFSRRLQGRRGGGSNLGPKHPDLRAKMIERAAAEKATAERPVPVDLVAASGSGLDPDISLEAASYQVGRVAAARKIPEERVRGLIDGLTNRSGSIIGAPERVNVLRLNLALDGVPIEE